MDDYRGSMSMVFYQAAANGWWDEKEWEDQIGRLEEGKKFKARFHKPKEGIAKIAEDAYGTDEDYLIGLAGDYKRLAQQERIEKEATLSYKARGLWEKIYDFFTGP